MGTCQLRRTLMPTRTMDGDCLAWAMRVAKTATTSSGNHKNHVKRADPALRPVAGSARSRRMPGILAVVLAVALAGRIEAGYREVDEGWRLAAAGLVDAAWTSDVYPITVDGLDTPEEKPAFGDLDTASAGAGESRVRSAQAGEFLDRHWYEAADKWQYYYLDQGQYNLLGGLSYLLGHPCYPKLFERSMEQAVGFDGRVHMFWYGICSYLPVDGLCGWAYYGPRDYQEFASAPRAGWGLPFSGGGLRFAQTAGDYLDRWRYKYMEVGQYRYLDLRQYNLLGGLGYMYGRFNYGWSRNYAMNTWGHGVWADYSHVPEPGTITLLALAALGMMRSRLRRS